MEIDTHQNTGGAEKAKREHIGLLLGLGFTAELPDVCIFGVRSGVTEKNVPQLVGNGKARGCDIVEVVIYNYPLLSIVVGFGILVRKKIVYSTILFYVDICTARDLQYVYGQTVDMIIKEAKPSAVSYVFINCVIHGGARC